MNPTTMNPTNRIILIDPATDPRWDRFVQNHPYGLIYHTSAWKTVLEKSFSHMKGYYFILEDSHGGNIQAALPVYLVKSWLLGKRLISIPFATLCDPLISSNEEMGQLLDAVIALSEELRTSFLEIKTFQSSDSAKDERLSQSDIYKNHYIMVEEDPEKLKKRFHRTCVRRKISKAINSNFTVETATEEDDLIDFYELYLMSRKRLNLPSQPYSFFKNILTILGTNENAQFLLAKNQGKLITGLMFYKYKNRVSAECLASDNEFYQMGSNHFLYWEAIKIACKEGYEIFDFGRSHYLNHGLMDFKNRWGTTVTDLSQFYYPHQSDEKKGDSFTYKTTKKLCGILPNFMYRSFGNFLYRHLG